MSDDVNTQGETAIAVLSDISKKPLLTKRFFDCGGFILLDNYMNCSHCS